MSREKIESPVKLIFALWEDLKRIEARFLT
jgi:hypothetical protein